MNKLRRKHIMKLVDQISGLQETMECLLEELTQIDEDETEYMDNIPENLQESERFAKAEAAVEALDEACEFLETARDALEDTLSSLDTAVE